MTLNNFLPTLSESFLNDNDDPRKSEHCRRSHCNQKHTRGVREDDVNRISPRVSGVALPLTAAYGSSLTNHAG